MEFDKVVDRTGTNCIKWDYIDEFLDTEAEVLPMWVADMDFLVAPPIQEAITKVARHGIYGYTQRPASYYQAIVDWLARRHGWQVQTKELLSTPGVVSGINAAILSLSQPGSQILVQSPVYHPFFSIVEQSGRQLVDSPLKFTGKQYEMDFVDLEKKFKAGVNIMILCSPHNPVGRVWSETELVTLAELCVKYKVAVISDEIWSDLVYRPAKHLPLAALNEEIALQTVTCLAPSKTFNLAGLNTAAMVVSNQEWHRKLEATIESLEIEMGNIFGIAALEAAYSSGEEWLEELLVYLEANLDLVKQSVAKLPGISLVEPQSTYLAWLDCRDLKLGSDELIRFMLEEARVGLKPGRTFGSGGDGFMRLNYACPRSLLKEGLQRITNAVNKNQ